MREQLPLVVRKRGWDLHWPAFAVGVAFAAVVVIGWHLMPGNWNGIQTIAVVVTGLSLIWYTWETKLLREIATRQLGATIAQVEAQIRPFVIIDRAYHPFTIRNIGLGPALNVRVHDVDIDLDHKTGLRFRPQFPVI